MKMKILVILMVTFLLSATGCQAQRTMGNRLPGKKAIVQVHDRDSLKAGESPLEGLYSPNTLIISYDVKEGKDSLKTAVKAYGATIVYEYQIINAISIRLPEGSKLFEAKQHFEKVKGVVGVSYDRIYRIDDPKPDRKLYRK